MCDFGACLKKGAKMGAEAYKIGKVVAPVAGEVWKVADKKSYNQYGVPAKSGFKTGKDIGKSVGGWNTVD